MENIQETKGKSKKMEEKINAHIKNEKKSSGLKKGFLQRNEEKSEKRAKIAKSVEKAFKTVDMPSFDSVFDIYINPDGKISQYNEDKV